MRSLLRRRLAAVHANQFFSCTDCDQCTYRRPVQHIRRLLSLPVSHCLYQTDATGESKSVVPVPLSNYTGVDQPMGEQQVSLGRVQERLGHAGADDKTPPESDILEMA
jgi:hypothetical protein